MDGVKVRFKCRIRVYLKVKGRAKPNVSVRASVWVRVKVRTMGKCRFSLRLWLGVG